MTGSDPTPRRTRLAPARAAVLATALVALLAACASSGTDTGSPPRTAAPASTPGTAAGSSPSGSGSTDPAWSRIDAALGELAPEVSLLAAEVEADGTCRAVHELEASTARPVGSQFKLVVLGALASKVASGEISWDQTLTIDDATKSIGNGEGSLQALPPGTTVPVVDAAGTMIGLSDNTASDLLMALVGRDAVEARAKEWIADRSANDPFLTTREMFLLHYVPGLGERYLDTPIDQRDAFLASEVDPRPVTDIGAGLTPEPRLVTEIEWFATPHDVCRTFAGLQELAADPALAPLSDILSGQVRGLDLDPAEWPTIWYKGGSEPGVLAMGWLATTADGRTFVVEATALDTEAPLAESSLTDMVAVAEDAFGVLAGS